MGAREASFIVHDLAIWVLCLVAVAGVLARPFGVPEWMWAGGCAVAVAALRLLPFPDVLAAIGRGGDVYLFLGGMMVLSELARREGVFDWIASHAVRGSGGSAKRLFAIVYAVGVAVTVVLSNDATAVVLTPAVAAAVRAAKAEPRPYLFACALIANAASFVLPISNPANLVVFAGHVPALGGWLRTFALPSACAIGLTFFMMHAWFRQDLAGSVSAEAPASPLRLGGKVTFAGIGVTALALLVASGVGANLGATTAVLGAVVFGVVAALDRASAPPVLRAVSWSVLALVAGLFVLVAAAETTGLLAAASRAAGAIAALPEPAALAATAFATALGSNVVNNLPAGLIAGTTVASGSYGEAFRSATAIGIDLGPNLSVTGSLATILWLVVLRREGVAVDAWQFLRIGAVVMPVALLAAVESLLVVLR